MRYHVYGCDEYPLAMWRHLSHQKTPLQPPWGQPYSGDRPNAPSVLQANTNDNLGCTTASPTTPSSRMQSRRMTANQILSLEE